MADEQQKYDQYLTGKIITTRNEDGGGDFEEQQMWDSSMHETNSSTHYYHKSSSSTTSSKLQFGRRPGGGSSTTKSAPMAIPDWQKIYGTAHEAAAAAPQHEEIFFKDEDEGEGEMMIPPHEYIARKLASSQISSFSVCEGAGRTLKGRDLSRVRNAILTKTGFIE
ncbi:hypothetical protein QQ045_008105 [Rhodiola kirilowii]